MPEVPAAVEITPAAEVAILKSGLMVHQDYPAKAAMALIYELLLELRMVIPAGSPAAVVAVIILQLLKLQAAKAVAGHAE